MDRDQIVAALLAAARGAVAAQYGARADVLWPMVEPAARSVAGELAAELLTSAVEKRARAGRESQEVLWPMVEPARAGRETQERKEKSRRARQPAAVVADEWASDEKRGEWNLILRQRQGRIDAFMKNPQGGGSGGERYPSVRLAIVYELKRVGWGNPNINPQGKDKVWVVLRAYDDEAQDYISKKQWWVDVGHRPGAHHHVRR